MVEDAGRARFLFEPADAVRVEAGAREQDLQGDVAPEARVSGTVDFTHSPLPEERVHLVRSDAGAACERHAAATASAQAEDGIGDDRPAEDIRNGWADAFAAARRVGRRGPAERCTISISMFQRTDDLRITQVRPLLPPAILLEEIPVTERASNVVANTRRAIANVLNEGDSRLVVVVGPCSVHDTRAALEYATRLQPLARCYEDELIVAMRCYFEKPRTSVGWKGLINDPDLDESYHINKGLRLARRLLLDVNDLGLPTASEFLDTQIPQFIADLTSWVAIGARTTESQVHRELASGLSMPVGFKNGTDGTTQIAVDAVLSARSPHLFPSVTKQGVSAIFETSGNDTCHVILRGGSRTGPNFDADHVATVCAQLAARELRQAVMIDCSHGNSQKDHRRQIAVAENVAGQIASGSWQIFGVMIESHLVEGRQDCVAGQPTVFGQSITDACLSLEQTAPLLERLARAQKARGVKAA
jgi:3-deoxy-7-phosphoheptulonate synthase